MAHSSEQRSVRLSHRIAIGEAGDWFVGALPTSSGEEIQAVLKRVERSPLTQGVSDGRLAGEARLLGRVRHPGVLQVLDFIETKDHHLLAFEYVEGIDAQELIKRLRTRERNLPVAAAVQITIELAEALDYLHNLVDDDGEALPVVVRKISPRTVLISWDGHVKLFDLTTAQHRMVEEPNATVQVGGDYAYLSPEEVAGGQGDKRSDIFHLGVVLYELLTLQRCFGKRSLEETIRFVRMAEYRSARELRPAVPASLVEVIDCALAGNPAARYETAGALVNALKDTLKDINMGGGDDTDLSRVLHDLLGSAPRKISLDTYLGDSDQTPIPIGADSEFSSPDISVDTNARQKLFNAANAQSTAEPVRVESVPSSAVQRLSSIPAPGPDSSKAKIIALSAALVLGGFLAGRLFAPGPAQDKLRPVDLAAEVAPPVPSAPATSTVLRVSSVPPGAEIFIDGDSTGERTPTTLPVLPGSMLISARLDGMRAKVQRVDVREGEETLVSVPFLPPSAVRKGALFIESEPIAQVSIGGRAMGETPLRKEELAPGLTNVVLRNSEHGFARTLRLQIAKGETLHHRYVAGEGTLNVESEPKANVFIGRTLLGPTPLKGVSLYEGAYLLRLVNREKGLKRQVRILIRTDQSTSIMEKLGGK